VLSPPNSSDFPALCGHALVTAQPTLRFFFENAAARNVTTVRGLAPGTVPGLIFRRKKRVAPGP
jgi:hypothetical protein